MYLSRLTFTTLPGHTRQVEEKLRGLRDLVGQAGGTPADALASLEAPDLVFEQELADLPTLEKEIDDVVANNRRSPRAGMPPDEGVVSHLGSLVLT